MKKQTTPRTDTVHRFLVAKAELTAVVALLTHQARHNTPLTPEIMAKFNGAFERM
jgi:hypothetical protein